MRQRSVAHEGSMALITDKIPHLNVDHGERWHLDLPNSSTELGTLFAADYGLEYFSTPERVGFVCE